MKKIEKGNDSQFLDISKLAVKPNGSAIAFVFNGKCKTAANGQPYYLLYLKDCNGESITGFKFNVADYIGEGLSLTAIKGKFVVIKYYDNYYGESGRSLVIDQLFLIEDQSSIDTSAFIGESPANMETCDEVLDFFSSVFDAKINFSKMKMLVRHYDYCGGKTGGVLFHHKIAVQNLQGYREALSQEEYRELVFAYLIFMVIHLDFVSQEDEEFSSSRIVQLLSYSEKLANQFGVKCRTEELIYYFSGVEPKSFYTRTVISIFNTVKKTLAELHVHRITPLNQVGSAGYGIVKRYS